MRKIALASTLALAMGLPGISVALTACAVPPELAALDRAALQAELAALPEGLPAREADILCALADNGDALAARALGQRFADDEDSLFDPAKADEVLALAADLGDARAAYLRAFLLMDLERPLDALASWERGVAGGYERAAFFVARGHARGDFGAASRPAEGVAALEALTAAGERGAKGALASVLATGPEAVLDAGRAAALYTELAEAGDARAFEKLGFLFSKGRGVAAEPARAAGYFRRAAEGGIDRAWLSLGKQYIKLGDGVQALEAFKDAAALGVPGAEREIALGHYRGRFGDASDRSAGVEGTVALAEAGDFVAARAVALKPPLKADADFEAILTNLETEAADGNPWAAEAAATFLRKFPGKVEDARPRLEAILEAQGDLMRPEVHAREMVHLLHNRRDLEGSVDRVAELLDGAGPDAGFTGLRETYKVSPNLYVALMQDALKERGYWTGPVHGMLTPGTTRALARFCLDAGINDICRRGPLASATLTAVSEALSAMPAQDG